GMKLGRVQRVIWAGATPMAAATSECARARTSSHNLKGFDMLGYLPLRGGFVKQFSHPRQKRACRLVSACVYREGDKGEFNDRSHPSPLHEGRHGRSALQVS